MSTEKIDPHLTAMIVMSYVRHHRVGTDQISDLITSVHQAFGQLGQPVAPEEVLVPAVSVRRSVHQDYVVCLECGYRAKTLRRHIGTQHGLDRDKYLSRWGLRRDHLLVAPAYSAQRSTLAKALGLGRKSTAQAMPEESPARTPVAVNQGSEAKPTRRLSRTASKSADVANEAAAAMAARRPRSASKSLTADGGNEVAAEPKPAAKRRLRSGVASPQPEQPPLASAET